MNWWFVIAVYILPWTMFGWILGVVFPPPYIRKKGSQPPVNVIPLFPRPWDQHERQCPEHGVWWTDNSPEGCPACIGGSPKFTCPAYDLDGEPCIITEGLHEVHRRPDGLYWARV